MRMKALVTGGTGFLGYRLALRLRNLGWEVLATGRSKEKGKRLENEGISFSCADLDHRDTIVSLCKGQDIVFHCGALSAPWGAYQDFYNANVRGTQHIIEGCRKYHIHRLIHVSTPSIYFQYKNQYHISEQDPLPLKKVNAYATTKWLAEQEIDDAFRQGLSTITIRPRALFGPGDNTILPRLLRANQRGALPLIHHGKTLSDVTYVDNVVDALLLCVTSPHHTLGKKYNITNGEPIYLADFLNQLLDRLEEPKHYKHMSYCTAYTMATIMEWIAHFQKKEPLLTRYTVGVLGKSQTLNIHAAQIDLGYAPRITLAEGIEKFASWWEAESCAQ